MSKSSELNNSLIPTEDEPLMKLSTAKYLVSFGIIYILFALDFASRYGMSTLFPMIQKELSLTDPQLGLLGSVVLFCIAVLIYPISYLADKFNKAKFISVMALIWSIFSIGSGFASGFLGLFVARFGLGVGEASYMPISLSLITDWTRKSKWGKAIGVYNSSMPFGIILGSVVAGLMGAKFGWRNTLIILGIPGVIFGLTALAIPAKKKAAPAVSKAKELSIKKSLALCFKKKTLLIMSISFGIYSITSAAVTVWLPSYCVRILRLTVPQGGMVLAVVGVMGLLAFPLGGVAVDKLIVKGISTRAWMAAIAYLVGGALAFGGFAFAFLPMVFIGFFISLTAQSAIITASQELLPEKYKSTGYGFMGAIFQIGGMFGPTIAGLFSQWFGLQSTMQYIQLFTVLGALGFFWSVKYYVKDYRQSRDEDAADVVA